MSEAEFDQLLDAVGDAVTRRADESQLDFFEMIGMPKAANDNDVAWPLIPFPAGWNAVC